MLSQYPSKLYVSTRRTLSYVYQNFDNTEVSRKEVAVGRQRGCKRETAEEKDRKEKSRDREMWAGDRLLWYMHNIGG